MSIEERKKLEQHLQDDFESVPTEIQSYFVEEMLNPEAVLGDNYERMPTAKKTEIINRAETRVRANCFDNYELEKAQLYLMSVSTYLLDRINGMVESEVFVR